jgi:phage gp36-like protein
LSYITTAQLEARLGATLYARLTDRVNGATADGAVGQQIVDEAEAVADGYLAARYATPIDLVAHPELGTMLTARVLDVAEWLAWKSSPFVSDVPERLRALHEESLRWFEMVADGRLSLPAAAPPASRTARDDGPHYSGRPRRFTAEELEGL